ncbi:Hypothetical Protein FCC1311_109812 [Hondaea fermentalgiana]|uniref:Uncharacterized protein n=1 Tax=Hondaea fermentalgiana TaxID=2315210 RepID=A0A2R5GWQ3_9STRA|nr:Hypothetical Protein FCC1311_109812 [Hondaea fermentalgiana]|eukprot:GBG34759.1 Hypothetical Protein FCC1311_109812 [Hondaea fermentalgiana]
MVALVGMAREQQGVAVAKAMLAQRARQLEQQQQQHKRMTAAAAELDEEVARSENASKVPVPPRPAAGYLARLWDNVYGENAQPQENSKRTRTRRRSTLREDVLERLNDGAQVTKMLQEVRDLLEGPGASVSRSGSTASASSVASFGASFAASFSSRSGSSASKSQDEDPVVMANGPLKRLPPASSPSNAAQKARRAVPQGPKQTDFVVTAPASQAADAAAMAGTVNGKMKRQCVCPDAHGSQCEMRSSRSLLPKSFWRTIRRRVLLA